jgi:DNA-directed RNA polymerase specialized sigma24 family protein
MDALSEIDWSRWSLFGMGLLMVLAGTGPVASEAAAPLIPTGAALAAAALVFPRLRSIDFGVVKAEIDSDNAAHRKLQVDIWKLQRFAWLVCGNAVQARKLVEDALVETRLARRSGGDRGIYALQSLVSLLENAREHELLVRALPAQDGRDRSQESERMAEDVVSEECRPTMDALAALPIRVRMTYLLRCSWMLTVEEVVQIVSSSPSEVSEAVAQGRQTLAEAL